MKSNSTSYIQVYLLFSIGNLLYYCPCLVFLQIVVPRTLLFSLLFSNIMYSLLFSTPLLQPLFFGQQTTYHYDVFLWHIGKFLQEVFLSINSFSIFVFNGGGYKFDRVPTKPFMRHSHCDKITT